MSESIFDTLTATEPEDLQILKELFTDENIEMKTELNDYEINLLSRVAFLQEVFNIRAIDIYVKKFMLMRVSKSRKGRNEFVKAIIKNNEQDVKKSILEKL